MCHRELTCREGRLLALLICAAFWAGVVGCLQ